MPFRAPDVAKLQVRGDLEGLVRATRYKKDEQVRADARRALCEQIDFLITKLATRNIRELLLVREALVTCGDPAVDALIFVHTDHQSVQRRQDAAYVLGMAGDARAVPVLITALRDTDPTLRMIAAEALGKIGAPVTAEPLRLVALKDTNAQVRKAATKAYKAVATQAEMRPA